MDPRRFMYVRSLTATGWGLITLGAVLLVIKLLIDVLHFLALGVGLVGVIMLIAGAFMRRT